jgi:adenine phosphoribosyltransferase
MYNMNYEDYIAVIPGFPKPVDQFKDVTSLMENGKVYKEVIREMAKIAKEMGAEVIVGPEARGFMFGCPVATELGLGFVPIRKKGKLPRETISYSYELEYGTDTLYMHKDAIKPGQKAVVIDDIVAVGGTMDAAKHLIEELGGKCVGMVALMGLTALPGVDRLKDSNLKCLIYDDVEDK